MLVLRIDLVTNSATKMTEMLGYAVESICVTHEHIFYYLEART
jgi:hypothetical protein